MTASVSFFKNCVISIGEQTKPTGSFYNLSLFIKYTANAFEKMGFADNRTIREVLPRINSVCSLMDIFEVPCALHHFTSGEAEWSSASVKTAAFGLAALAGSVEFLGELGFVRKVTVLSLGQVACGFAALAFLVSAAEAIEKFRQADSNTKKNEALMSVASNVFNVALYAVMASGAVFPALIGIGLAAKGMEVARHIYATRHSAELR